MAKDNVFGKIYKLMTLDQCNQVAQDFTDLCLLNFRHVQNNEHHKVSEFVQAAFLERKKTIVTPRPKSKQNDNDNDDSDSEQESANKK
jgi:hypothetical protein